MNYILYARTNGRIIQKSSNSSGVSMDILNNLNPEANALEYDGEGNWNSHYVLNEVVTERPSMSLTTIGLITTGVPAGTSVTVTDSDFNITVYTITDGEADMTGSSPGTYQLLFKNFPYQSETLEVIVE
jgi:hypothetical protein